MKKNRDVPQSHTTPAQVRITPPVRPTTVGGNANPFAQSKPEFYADLKQNLANAAPGEVFTVPAELLRKIPDLMAGIADVSPGEDFEDAEQVHEAIRGYGIKVDSPRPRVEEVEPYFGQGDEVVYLGAGHDELRGLVLVVDWVRRNIHGKWEARVDSPSLKRGAVVLVGAEIDGVAPAPRREFPAAEPTSLRSDILAEAAELIDGERAKAYGSAKPSFGNVAMVWSAILGVEVEDWQVPLMLAGLKMIRVSKNSAHRDSWVDIAGYAALGGDVAGVMPRV